jgi:predicted nuclease with TOPRIM domain
MAAGEEGQVNAKEAAVRRANETDAELARLREELKQSRGDQTALTGKHSELAFDHAQCEGVQVSATLGHTWGPAQGSARAHEKSERCSPTSPSAVAASCAPPGNSSRRVLRPQSCGPACPASARLRQVRLRLTIEEQASRVSELEAALADAEELREKNRFLQAELRGRDGTLAENEEQLEEMEVPLFLRKCPSKRPTALYSLPKRKTLRPFFCV